MTDTTQHLRQQKRRMLVLTDVSLDSEALRDVIALAADHEPPTEWLVVAPALNSRIRHWMSDVDEARQSAGRRLGASLASLRTMGAEATGHVADADPLQAISDALNQFPVDEIAIATQGEGRQHWLTRNLVDRARHRFAQPVVQIRNERARLVRRRRATGRERGSISHSRPSEA